MGISFPNLLVPSKNKDCGIGVEFFNIPNFPQGPEAVLRPNPLTRPLG